MGLKLRKLVTNDWGNVFLTLLWGEFQVLLQLLGFWSHFMGCIDVCLEKRRGDSGLKQVLISV